MHVCAVMSFYLVIMAVFFSMNVFMTIAESTTEISPVKRKRYIGTTIKITANRQGFNGIDPNCTTSFITACITLRATRGTMVPAIRDRGWTPQARDHT